ncbi:hypothetical protein CC80DRAFT_263102 [Byssothecium circinans]|uniref:Uncharacterized protein n=1 Tax=Byssothecium circinans TaxID=147558 RepID=A0A6A5UI12_9PLEO|nr:hypothetical protein CC80DRAFT_263102 [Byssothecium circinans]
MYSSAQLVRNQSRGIPQVESIRWSRLQTMGLSIILHCHPGKVEPDCTIDHSNHRNCDHNREHSHTRAVSYRLVFHGLLRRGHQVAHSWAEYESDWRHGLVYFEIKNSCYLRAYGFAGVQQGHQCWCGSYVGGEWAEDQGTAILPIPAT